jgi:hypothetical protein
MKRNSLAYSCKLTCASSQLPEHVEACTHNSVLAQCQDLFAAAHESLRDWCAFSKPVSIPKVPIVNPRPRWVDFELTSWSFPHHSCHNVPFLLHSRVPGIQDSEEQVHSHLQGRTANVCKLWSRGLQQARRIPESSQRLGLACMYWRTCAQALSLTSGESPMVTLNSSHQVASRPSECMSIRMILPFCTCHVMHLEYFSCLRQNFSAFVPTTRFVGTAQEICFTAGLVDIERSRIPWMNL